MRAHVRFLDLEEIGQAPVGKSLPLQLPQFVGRDGRERTQFELQFERDDFLDLREEPPVDLRVTVDFLEGHADAERIRDIPEPLGSRICELVGHFLGVDGLQVEAIDADFESAQRLLQRLLERASDGHHLTDGFHLRREAIVGLLEFFEREARNLGDDIIDRRFERRGRKPTGDVVAQLVERVTDREFCGDLGDGKPGGLRRERGRARHARIHFDDDHPAVVRVDRELDVRAAGIDADLAQHGDRRVAHDLVFLVRQRLRRRDGDRVARVHAHRVEVLDRADDDAVVLAIAHDLHFEFFPAEQRLLDQKLARRRQVETALADVVEFVLVVSDAAAGAAQRVRRPNDGGKADVGLHALRIVERVGDARTRRA